MPQLFLSITDSTRADAALGRLLQHNINGWALTGGLAVALHSVAASMEPNGRSLNDLDFVTERFEEIPETLAKISYFAMFIPANNQVAQ